MKRFVPIARKVTTIIIVSLVIGIGAISFYFSSAASGVITETTRTNLEQQSGLLFRAVESIMVSGRAEDALSFFTSLEQVGIDYMVALYRSDGTPAFSDSVTIEYVNARLEKEMFDPASERLSFPPELYEPGFEMATSPVPQMAFFYPEPSADGRRSAEIYKPLINLPKCTGCHGDDHTIRGIVDIRADITEAFIRQQRTAVISASLFLGVVLFLSVVLTQFLQRAVILPVKRVGEVCSRVTGGFFDSRVRIGNRDEIGALGETVNQMVEGLRERFELSKYVSSSTIRSLGESESGAGARVPLTILFSDIRGFTSYTERNDPETVVGNLNGILNAQTDIIHDCGGDIDKYVGDEIVAMFTEDDSDFCACVAAVRIQRAIRERSDGEFGGLSVGIGINTGDVILGRIGSDRRADFTFIGDEVNTTSRLCDAAKPGQILISRATFERVRGRIVADGPYRLKVKGKDRYVRVYLLQDIDGTPSGDAASHREKSR